MKKYLKIIFIIIGIILLTIIFNSLRNYLIINNLMKSFKNYKENTTNYYIVKEDYSTINNEEIVSKSETYYKDGIYSYKTYYNNDLSSIGWLNTKTNESLYYDVENSTEVFPKTQVDHSNLFYISDWTISNYILNILIAENNIYRIRLAHNVYMYCNKDTGVCVKYEVVGSLPLYTIYTITENCVSDIDIEKPQI